MIRTGLDLISGGWPARFKGASVGLLVHPASVNSNLDHAVDLFSGLGGVKLISLFGPQHGIRGETQDNMIEWEGFRDVRTGLPVNSLYGSTRVPGHEMLEGLDALVIDLQDVGARYYTFIWTMALCMSACQQNDISVIILDRPNPINGVAVEGPVLEPGFSSFVGMHPLPVRHGMTIGEIGAYLKDVYYQRLDLHVIRMKGWKRKMWFNETGLPWVLPSPNIPSPGSAVVYPGMCLLEATNVSEGRGTTRPFEIFGSPFIEPHILTKRLRRMRLPGVVFRPLYFEPTFHKYKGTLCGGAQIHVTEKAKFLPFLTGVAVIKAIFDLYPDDFCWNDPPYEYENEKLPIDILCGTDRIRNDIELGKGIRSMEKWWTGQSSIFSSEVRKRYMLYER